jgi:methyl-galactoside transport system substrate-binding protein
MKSYDKAVILSTDSKQAGILQGNLIAKEWNENKAYMDKNSDNIMQYIMLIGSLQDVAAAERTQYSISTIEDAGIKTQELASTSLNWDQAQAKLAVESLFLKYNGRIEVIIANSDALAIGAIEALQKYGYNNGDKSNTIPVFGIDGTQAAKDLIKKGVMAGTVIQDPAATADALYTIGINLAQNKNPLENTNYKFNETGIVVKLPYYEYTEQ